MDNYKKNLKLLTENHVYSKDMEHDACGVGVIASTEGKKSREIVEYGIEALNKYGAIKGSLLTIKRILRCNPWSDGGYDPIP